MANANIPPVPYKAQVTGAQGIISTPWAAWFRQLYNTVITASQIDATVAASNAEAAASAAAASATNAHTAETQANTYAGNAAISATNAATSAGLASVSASTAVAQVLAAEALMDSLGVQAYSPDYITDAVNIPIHRQLIAFQRVTIASGGSLQIYGRGRIL